jgi:hypothetical protein
MTFIGWHGDACTRCVDNPDPKWRVQRATHHGLCARCWLGATETQRRDALLEEAMREDGNTDAPALTTEAIALELLLALPDAPEPDERHAA